jgi:hypothetical protein
MSRNRMRNSQSLHWMGVVKWVLIAGMLSVLGLSYMLCKNQNLHLAQETYRLELQLEGIQKRNSQLTYDLETMKSPVRLVRRLAQMHSTLVRLSDLGQQMVVRMDQTPRAQLVPLGTIPRATIDYSSPTMASSGASAYGTSSSSTSP